ncbi:YjgF/chorismate_mutase-like putative endoribonuclease [Chitinophaga niastensis]|uniref:YjgF/chorismate_mutase-like putative endoribonuclease n=1 Tax=Chitinophaga niastensis TaxID=536980 RepID=A0A2P8HCE5_CHINA|nr:RidA family protein [Chitinophaga niastensis]PSL43910.1 YjgF/chorismate_mutase-like putative endoribonuclease [Chitinophaga niastensis]
MDIRKIHEQLKAEGFTPENTTPPGGSYVSVNIRANIAYIAIQFPIAQEQFLFTGRLGQELTTQDGYKAAKLAAMNVLGQINKYVGFDKITGLNHIDVYYQAAGNWDDGPIVANGASDLFLNIPGDAGKHSRAIFGVDKLPRNFSVGLTTSFTIKED